MRIGSDNNYIEVAELERAPEDAPNAGDVRVSVQVVLGEFRGQYDSVWLEEPVLRDFISALCRVETERSGSAVLESCSPDEFIFELRARDTLGHFVVEVSLCRYQYSGPTYWATKVSGGFEIEPSSLRSILNGFGSLHAPNG
ncbi:WapI family immunity protein [Methyloversatilis discipulorum]|uniref:WapI family immunity protein n=1 Tax=Methyloversatilis discipulorum TaxID=1119528 RepID=UPI003F6592BD